MRSIRTTTCSLAATVLLVAACGDLDDTATSEDTEVGGPAAVEADADTPADDGALDDASQTEADVAGAEGDGADAADDGSAGSADTDQEAPEDRGHDLEDADGEADATAAWQHLGELDDPVVYESNGIRLAITGVGLSDLTADEAADELREMHDFIDDDARTLLALEMEASNDSGEEINLYANQGTIHLGREQVEADLWLSESFAGAEWRDGVDDDGLVVWVLSTGFEEAVAEGRLDYTTSAPSSAETWDTIADDIDLTVEWDAP